MKKWIKRIIFTFLVICVGIGSYLTVKGYEMYREALNNTELSQMVDSIRKKDSYTTLDQLPSTYIDAVIAVEDQRFYKHNGIDILSIGRAIFNDIKAMSLVEGGSTITQQLAKNLYFTQEKDFVRKIAEVFMAKDIESQYNKDEILELYLNSIYFGNNLYSVKEACNAYYFKDPIDMTDYESTLLAGIPNAPTVYASTENIYLAKQRQQQVLDRMVKCKYITKDEATLIINQNQ